MHIYGALTANAVGALLLGKGDVMKVSDIIKIIEKVAPLGAAAPWDASGVQVAAMRADAEHVAGMLSTTLATHVQTTDDGSTSVLANNHRYPPRTYNTHEDHYLALRSFLYTSKS